MRYYWYLIQCSGQGRWSDLLPDKEKLKVIRRPQPTARGSAFEEHWITKVLEFQSLDFLFHLAEGVQTVVLEVQSLESFFFDSEGDVTLSPFRSVST